MSKPSEMPQDFFDLYAAFGIAAEKAQLLETEAGNVVLCHFAMFVDKNNITREDRLAFRSLSKNVNRKTLGAAIKAVKATGNFDPILLEKIDKGLEARNYLVHKFFRFHNFAIHSEEGRRLMGANLLEVDKALQETWGVLSAVSNNLSQMAGLPSQSSEDLSKLIAAGRNKDVGET